MKYTARPATVDDAVFVAEHLRAADRAEVEAASGRPPQDVLTEALLLSGEAYAATLVGDPKPFMLFGVVDDPANPGAGLVWLMATDRVHRAKLMVVRASRVWLSRWAQRYHTLHNFVDTRNTLHLRWLRLMGFTFTKKFLVREHPFQHFILKTKAVQPCANQSPSLQQSAG